MKGCEDGKAEQEQLKQLPIILAASKKLDDWKKKHNNRDKKTH
jgi:hypothetical protein